MLGMEIMRSGGPPLGPEFINGQAQPPRNVRLDARAFCVTIDDAGDCRGRNHQPTRDLSLSNTRLDHERPAAAGFFCINCV